MPIYEYKCQQCGTHYEKRQNVSDEPLTTCEKCHGKLEKQWSLSGFQFKGAGWYVTDYAGKKAESGSATKSEEKSTSSSDEKSSSTEKSTATESTAKTEAASKTTSDSTTTKKD